MSNIFPCGLAEFCGRFVPETRNASDSYAPDVVSILLQPRSYRAACTLGFWDQKLANSSFHDESIDPEQGASVLETFKEPAFCSHLASFRGRPAACVGLGNREWCRGSRLQHFGCARAGLHSHKLRKGREQRRRSG